ncbi:MAG: AzlC family ABC transporter permease [Zoogloeaceae bacterium]|nr:AzlC family ABC transporter permease [Zoogloeaceae bacterium]
MNASFRQGAREGFRVFLPVSVGIIPWAVVTGVAMRASGMTVFEAMAMNFIVFAGTAQLGALPLLVAGAPLWLIAVTTFALNLRFLIFSAAIAPAFQGFSLTRRLLSGYILVDGVFAVCAERLLKSDDPHWRWGFYIAPSLWAWAIWQFFGAIGAFGASSIPADWSLEFMTTIALMVMMVPLTSSRPMLVAALVGGLGAVVFQDLPLRLGLIVGMAIGMLAGYLAERGVRGRPA